MDGDAPYLNHRDYIADLAALCAVYKDDVQVTTTQKNTKVCKMIWNLTSPNKTGLYFNSLRRLVLLPPEQRPQLSSGTSAVEKFNAQTDKKFRNVPEMYQSTLEVNCWALGFLTLFSHNCAEYCPTDCQVSQQTVFDHNLGVWQFSNAEWQSMLTTSTPLLEKRKEHKQRISKCPGARSVGKKKTAAMSKRPAARVILKNAHRQRVIKRHTYNKRRTA